MSTKLSRVQLRIALQSLLLLAIAIAFVNPQPIGSYYGSYGSPYGNKTTSLQLLIVFPLFKEPMVGRNLAASGRLRSPVPDSATVLAHHLLRRAPTEALGIRMASEVAATIRFRHSIRAPIFRCRRCLHIRTVRHIWEVAVSDRRQCFPDQ